LSKTADSPIIALFEDRPKQGMVYQLNLSVYLDARVVFVSSLKELSGAMAGPEGVQLAIVRADFKGRNIADQVADLLLPKGIPVISLGGKERDGVIAVEDGIVKPMLQAAAKILGVTPQKMVEKTRPDLYEIAPEFLQMLFTAPCKIFKRNGEKLEKIFGTDDIISREKVKPYVSSREPLVIDAFHRLRLANAVTEQNLNAAKDLASPNVSEEKKMTILSSSLDMVAAQFKNAGMDVETVELANSSIKAISKIAESATNVGSLVKQLLAAEGGYRYAHSQLLTFLGFHVIKMMGWWGDDQRTIISQAAFYHDISLSSDTEAKFRSAESLKAGGITDPQVLETILTHAQLSARELQSVPDILPEVVRVVLSHHGSPIGKGFSTDISKLDNLSRAFYLSEEWADYLMALSESDQVPDNSARIAELKNLYKDDLNQQIIETFRYLDPEQFTNDFLEAPDYSLGAGAVDNGFAEALVSGSASVEEAAAAALKAGAAEAESETNVAAGEASKDEEILVKGSAESADESEKRIAKGKAAAATKKKIGGVTDVRNDEEVVVGGAEQEEEGQNRIAADKAAFAAKKKIDGVTDVRKDEEVLVAGDGEAESEERRFENEKAAAAKTKIEGVTDVRRDEEILIKGEKNAKDLIDRSIVRIKADTPEAQRELKMKSIAGSSEFMKAALGGDFDAVNAIIAAASNLGVEMRKTDADGRTAIHYAAMGGSIPVMKLLLEKGAQLNSVDSKRRSPLFLAALHKQNEAFDFLLGQGGKIGQQAMGGMTIAMIGAFSGNVHVLKAAVEKGVRLDTKDHNGKTAVEYAKQSKNAEVIQYLESLAAAAKKPAAA